MQPINLQQFIEKYTNSNTLYISDHFFCLDDTTQLHFFYNPKQYWTTIDKVDIEQYVIENLAKECAVLKNVRIVEDSARKPQNYTKIKAFNLETPTISFAMKISFKPFCAITSASPTLATVIPYAPSFI